MPDGSENIKVDAQYTPIYLYIVADIVPRIQQFADEASLTPDSRWRRIYGVYESL